MATRAWQYTLKHGGIMEAVVTGLLNGDVTDLLELPGWADKTIQIDGVFGVGGTIQVRGANDDEGVTAANWFALHLADAPASTFNAVTLRDARQIIENFKYIKAFVTAGDGATNLEVRVMATTPR